MTKEQLRNELKAQRRVLSADDIAEKSHSISERLFSLDCFRQAETVMIYLSAFKEPSTAEIFHRLISDGKNIAVPISNTDNYTITPSLVLSEAELHKGAYGILEPAVCRPISPSDIELALIPGIAFDRRGMRTGFGKGYYDRFLANFKGKKIGICYDFQIKSAIPADSHDIGMDIIITEKEIYDDF